MNQLFKEKSPYLLQHKDNPVHWHSWGDSAFELARKGNKPIFLSIGYSTCYWCHVMEKDSFETDAVAEILNKHFVSIKVDREERPDVDAIYMSAVMAMTGRGGWPMSVFLTPELRPFYGGTYFPRAQFMQLLQLIHNSWLSNREAIADTVLKLSSVMNLESHPIHGSGLGDKTINLAGEQLSSNFDSIYGGFSVAPKFPPSTSIRLLIRLFKNQGNQDYLRMITLTLDKMAKGGLFDQIGGGFHRYSTDQYWLVPHFEKMLYDNALLTVAYLEAFQLTKNPFYQQVAESVLKYVIRDMTDKAGGFYSAEDAGEVGKEGEFYVWGMEELNSILTPEELETAKAIFGISEQGNFEHQTNILTLSDVNSLANADNLEQIKSKLSRARARRERPLLDRKILTSWNGLMIEAFLKGFQVTLDPSYLEAAEKAANFVKSNLWVNGRLLHRYCDKEAGIEGMLDDYAFLIQALISLFEATAEESWLTWAIQLQKLQDALFWDNKDYGYYYTSLADSSLIIRRKEFSDSAEPSGNAVSLLNLLRLNDLTYDSSYLLTAENLLRAVPDHINKYTSAFSSLLIALSYKLGSSRQVVVVEPPGVDPKNEVRKYLAESFQPSQIVVWTSPKKNSTYPLLENKTLVGELITVYLCQNQTCQKPISGLEKIKNALA